jgi:hypothetical protein
MRDVEATMPAIASLEELKMVRRDFRSMFLVVTPNDLRLRLYGGFRFMVSVLEFQPALYASRATIHESRC